METPLTAQFDVLLVSAFGRGNWLAMHLSEQDWRVALVDVTPSLGAWEPADWDGPFGLFESDSLLASQKRQWLQSTEPDADVAPRGFTFWLPSGPLEGHGELSGFLSAQHEISTEARAYLQLLSDVEQSELRRERGALRRRRFEDVWLAHLAHQVAANVYDDNDVALERGAAIPFYAPYFQRSVHAGLLEDGLRACEKRGVKVLRNASIGSLRFDGSWPTRTWSSITLGHGQEFSAHAGVWMLSSIETNAVAAPLTAQLFPKGKQSPSWCWLRFEMSTAISRVSQSLPLSFAVVGDLFLPWTHANLVHVRKQHAAFGVMAGAGKRLGLDVWARVPIKFRFERAYLERVQNELLTLLQNKIPASDLQGERLPLELHHGADDLQAPRWPIYENEGPSVSLKLKNFTVNSPEQWAALDPLSQFRSQKKILMTLENQKRLRDERAARAQKRDQMREQKREARREARDQRREQKEQSRD